MTGAWLARAAIVACHVLPLFAYIPALPTNDSSQLAQSDDFIQLTWKIAGTQSQQGVFKDSVSRQLVADNSTQVGTQYAARGALVHFSEQNATQDSASPPWIAFVSCDRNATNASVEVDIFTEVRDHGAVAALLYSLTSAGCLMNQEYINDFEKPVDVYTTTSLQAAKLINSQFNSVDASAYWYASNHLNDSATSIWQQLNKTASLVPNATSASASTSDDISSSDTNTLSSFEATSWTVDYGPSESVDELDSGLVSATDMNALSMDMASTTVDGIVNKRATTTPSKTSASASATPTSFSYLIALLASTHADLATNSSRSPTNTTTGPSGDKSSGGGTNMTGLAMIILYAVTGCVTVMFLIVIIAGAIKALRHPERYGPRNGTRGGRPAQTRARGMTRAILDTFPVVKFGSNDEDASRSSSTSKVMQMGDLEAGKASASVPTATVSPTPVVAVPVIATATAAADQEATQPSPPLEPSRVDPSAVNNVSTCPICVQDFEDGDDLRVLPCDVRHRFHRDCIDPWLLDVSSLCPLCRWDLAQDADGQHSHHDDDEEEEEEDDYDAYNAYVGNNRRLQRRRERNFVRRDRATRFVSRARRLLSISPTSASPSTSASPGQQGQQPTQETTTGSGFTHSRFARYFTQIRESRAAIGRRTAAPRTAAPAAAATASSPRHSQDVAEQQEAVAL